MTTLLKIGLIPLAVLLAGYGRYGRPVETSTTRDILPPFHGTIFLDPDILTAADPTAFRSISYLKQAPRTMFDRRVNAWIRVKAFLFRAVFDDGMEVEVQVNPEFEDATAAAAEALNYAREIGRLPAVLRREVKTVWIHKGVFPFGGGNNNILIHTGQAALYQKEGILEETLIHEATHTSLDSDHARSAGWLSAQKADSNFISTYARDNPLREDMAETFLLYLAVRYRAERISEELEATITRTIPNRMLYFDKLALALHPMN